MRRILVERGSRYSTHSPVLGLSRSIRSVSIEPVQISPLLAGTTSYGSKYGVGTLNSVIFSVFGSKRPMALAPYSANQRILSASTRPRRGREAGVGVW